MSKTGYDKLAESIIYGLCDRSGFDNWFLSLDSDLQNEITQEISDRVRYYFDCPDELKEKCESCNKESKSAGSNYCGKCIDNMNH